MAAAETNTFSHNDRRGSSDSNSMPLTTTSTTDQSSSLNNIRSNSLPRPGQHLDGRNFKQPNKTVLYLH